MPPPMNPQGSRAGLITAVVVLSILFVTSAIFAFYFSAEASKEAAAGKTREQLISQFASAEAQADQAVQPLVELRNDPKYQGQSVLQIAMAQRAELTQQNAALSSNVAQLTTRVKELEGESQEKSAQLDALTDKLKQETALREKVQAEMTAKIDEQGKEFSDRMTKLTSQETSNNQSVTKIQGEVDRALKAAQAETSKRQQELAQRDSTIADLRKEIDVLRAKVPRLEDTANSVIRQADGRIVRVPGNDNVFINLGLGDRVTPGMTFEVYDRFAGVPAPSDDDDPTTAAAIAAGQSLPKGKASIEVVRPSRGQSECRIVRQTPGQPVIEGDVIANLVYDRNTTYNFVVFGDFDLDQNGTPTPGDAEVVRRLITQWGGRLATQVSVNTDFVVLGAEPEVPAQEENPTATDIDRQQAAQRALEAYQDVRDAAIKFNVPILNQNKFLYYIGHFEQAQR